MGSPWEDRVAAVEGQAPAGPSGSRTVDRLQRLDHLASRTAAHQPLPNMYIAATRKSPTAHDAPPLRPDFALPLDVAVAHGTRESAWACFEERRRGMLRAGLAADFAILDTDPFLAGAESMLSARVVRTVVGGSTVHAE